MTPEIMHSLQQIESATSKLVRRLHARTHPRPWVLRATDLARQSVFRKLYATKKLWRRWVR